MYKKQESLKNDVLFTSFFLQECNEMLSTNIEVVESKNCYESKYYLVKSIIMYWNLYQVNV